MRGYHINSYGLGFGLVLFFGYYLSCGLSYSLADEKKKYEPIVGGVMIVSLDMPLRATIGEKVNIEVIIGNERTTKETTILTIACPTTKQMIGREAETLDGLSSQKIVYSWDTKGLKEDIYTIRAELEKVPRETFIDDNVREIKIFLIP